MSNLIKGELYKLRKSKYFVGMMFLSVIVGFFLTDMWSRDRELNVLFAHDTINVLDSIQYAFGFIVLSSFLFALLAGEFIAKDFKTNKLSNSFSYGYTRDKVILSKFIVFIIFSLFLEIIYLTIFVIYVSSRHGFCEVLNLSMILKFIRIFIGGILFNLATISLLAMVAIITKSVYLTFISPVFILFSFMCWVNYGLDSHIFQYLPYIRVESAVREFASEAEVTKSIISLFLTFSITIGGSLLYTRYDDIN